MKKLCCLGLASFLSVLFSCSAQAEVAEMPKILKAIAELRIRDAQTLITHAIKGATDEDRSVLERARSGIAKLVSRATEMKFTVNNHLEAAQTNLDFWRSSRDAQDFNRAIDSLRMALVLDDSSRLSFGLLIEAYKEVDASEQVVRWSLQSLMRTKIEEFASVRGQRHLAGVLYECPGFKVSALFKDVDVNQRVLLEAAEYLRLRAMSEGSGNENLAIADLDRALEFAESVSTEQRRPSFQALIHGERAHWYFKLVGLNWGAYASSKNRELGTEIKYRLFRAIRDFEQSLALNPHDPNAGLWSQRLQTSRSYLAVVEKDIPTQSGSVTRIVVSTPRPRVVAFTLKNESPVLVKYSLRWKDTDAWQEFQIAPNANVLHSEERSAMASAYLRIWSEIPATLQEKSFLLSPTQTSKDKLGTVKGYLFRAAPEGASPKIEFFKRE